MCTKFCKTELVVFTFELFVKRVSRTMTSDSGHVWVFPPTGLVRTNAKVPVFVLFYFVVYFYMCLESIFGLAL